MPQNYAQASTEPSLDELMADPIMDLLLKRDRLSSDDAWAAVEAARRRLAIQRWRGTDVAPPTRDAA
jgi:hypothetical protein